MAESNLYGDLESLGALEEAKKLRETVAVLQKQQVALETELDETKEQVKKLADEKDVMEKNLHAVWMTAKAEMDRKDKLIAELNNKMASFGSRGGASASNKARKLK
tara:strand:+ start:212 stop:529 length:318 start_codon:yes stop_codon:yes gene_type:complete